MRYSERSIEIDAPVERVFDMFSDFENFPRWMQNLAEVRPLGQRHTHWVVDLPNGRRAEWEAVLTAFEPDHRVAWRSVRGDLRTEYEAIFEQTRSGSTLLRVLLGYDPALSTEEVLRGAFGDHPGRQLEEDLEHFAYVVEGRRRSEAVRPQTAPLRSQTDSRRVNFERAMSDARRSRPEGRPSFERRRTPEMPPNERQYDEDRSSWPDSAFEPTEIQPYRSGPPDMDMEPKGPGNAPEIYRYAMTPREREAERRELSGPSRDTWEDSRRFLRRGVDKLMDEPPSSRWREGR
jgi:uncharacterized protein YndB with AHSA1/START domain